MKRNVICEIDSKIAISFPKKIEENNDGTFRDVDEDTTYYKGGYTYYEGVDVPDDGLWKCRYTYDPDEGFKLAYTQADVIAWQKQAQEEISHAQKRRADFEDYMKKISDDAMSDKDKISVLQETVCELYEMIIEMEA